MAKKKDIVWHPYGRRLLLRAIKQKGASSKVLTLKPTAEEARKMYKFFLEEKGSLVPDDLVIGNELYVMLPGLEFIEGVTNEDDQETYFFLDFNFIRGQREPKKTK